ncbi:hypothetical protein PUNSTDRAFT_137808 [Punctularia strigosozonata HHB-11173 SS5]|uniref:Uncharacterized protein n=1 Tax=Punctularia strigosozonata (strain HHB-11173) TaxID=741275 RepID=R7S598_PUNST|nr:uncharacterized protein PUNSTDRAFT_137808 [Punctularia strigosozonata HHB-11173 SS5]EIN05124.1 hypothetical protein PUNSTDRAFT_137808 [Punctularia strigosozonata HHB-11173 SS5]
MPPSPSKLAQIAARKDCMQRYVALVQELASPAVHPYPANASRCWFRQPLLSYGWGDRFESVGRYWIKCHRPAHRHQPCGIPQSLSMPLHPDVEARLSHAAAELAALGHPIKKHFPRVHPFYPSSTTGSSPSTKRKLSPDCDTSERLRRVRPRINSPPAVNLFDGELVSEADSDEVATVTAVSKRGATEHAERIIIDLTGPDVIDLTITDIIDLTVDSDEE